MIKISQGSFKDSRFYFDENIPDDLSRIFYERWIEESCRGYADFVFVALDREDPCGFISCHLDAKEKVGRIGLIGVQNENRGRGIGAALVARAQSCFSSAGAQKSTVTTQARNIGAQRLYNKLGFRVSRVSLYYHKWYKAEPFS